MADYQRELEEFTGESWEPFFSQWLNGSGNTDWNVQDVSVTETETGYRTEAIISQAGEINEPVEVEVSFEDSSRPFRLATLSEAAGVEQDGIHVERLSADDWLVTLVSDEEPAQVRVDPDGVVMDSDPYNNLWKPEWSARVSPFYTPVDEASLMQPWQKHGMVAGFGIDGDGRFGLRGAFISSDRYRISPFIAYTAATASRNTDYLSAGIDAIVYNMPSAN